MWKSAYVGVYQLLYNTEFLWENLLETNHIEHSWKRTETKWERLPFWSITQQTLQHSCPFTTDLHERENLHVSLQLLSDTGNMLGISLHFTVAGETTLQQGFNISTCRVHLMTSIPACWTSITTILKIYASYSISTPPLANQLRY